MKNQLALFIFLISLQMGWGQDFNNYQPLQCSGLIPEAFLTPSSEKFQSDLDRITRGTGYRERKSRKQFYLESNFTIDNLLRSGMVLFNDPVSVYIRDVAAELLKDDPELLDSLSFYTLRTTAVNAFSTDQGYIFLTMGMMAQLENEAQLAFVLAHEIAHFEKKHAIDFYVTVDKLEKDYDRPVRLLNSTSFSDWELAKSYYSKENELEADAEGLSRFLKTSYDLNAVHDFFNVLKYRDLPIEMAEFDKGFFETPNYRFPPEYVLKIEGEEDRVFKEEDDSRSSHPNISKRIAALRKLVREADNENRLEYLVSGERFNEMRQAARFELVHYYLHDESFYETIYVAYLLLKEHPDNAYLRKSIAKALYCLAKYRNSAVSFPLPEGGSFRKSLNGLSYFLHKLDAEEMSVLAVHYAWQLQRDLPADEDLKELAQDAVLELVHHHERTLSEFTKVPVTHNDISQVNHSESEKINAWESSDYMSSVFVGFKDLPEFSESFQRADELSVELREYEEWNESPEGHAENRKEEKKFKRQGQRLGLNSVLLVNPLYLRIDARKKEEKMEFMATETGKDKFHRLLEKNAGKFDLELEILNVSSLTPEQTEQFNEIVVLNEWLAEQMDFEELTITPGHRQYEIRMITEKYGTRYLAWAGVISMQEKRSNSLQLITIGLTYPPLLPFMALAAMAPKNRSLMFFMIYDAETGSRKVVKSQYLKSKDRESLLNTHIYDALLQIQSKPVKP